LNEKGNSILGYVSGGILTPAGNKYGAIPKLTKKTKVKLTFYTK
jgi:hypothetical protein